MSLDAWGDTDRPFEDDLTLDGEGMLMGTPDPITHAQAIAGRHRKELGWVMRASLERASERGGLFVRAESFAYVHHRRDGQTTLHAICSERPGDGRCLLYLIRTECRKRGQTSILARCPVDLESNAWYRKRGFTLARTEPGKTRALNVWVLAL